MNAYVYVLIAAAIGAVLGSLRAGRLGGTRLDRLQYGAVFAIVGALAATLATILLFRLG